MCWYFLFQYIIHTLRLIVEQNIRQMPPHDSAGTLLLFWRNSPITFRIIVAHFRQWHVKSPSWAQELFVVCWRRHGDFTNPQRKKSLGVKLYDLVGQFWSPLRGMTRPGNFSRNNSVVSRAVWQVAPSCWNHMSSISIPSNWGHKNTIILLR